MAKPEDAEEFSRKLQLSTFDKLKVTCCADGPIALWNRFSLFIFKNINSLNNGIADLTVSTVKVIQQVLISKKFALCIDSRNYGHVIQLITNVNNLSLNDSKPTLNLINLLGSCQINLECCLISSFESSNMISVKILKYNAKMETVKKFVISLPLVSVNKNATIFIKAFPAMTSKEFIAVYSHDHKSLMMNNLNLNTKNSNLVHTQLYQCPSAFSEIAYDHSSQRLLIVLYCGTLLILNTEEKVLEFSFHLCSRCDLAILAGKSLMFTDKISLFRIDNIFEDLESSKEIIPTKIKLPYSMSNYLSGIVICTTFTNNVHVFNVLADGGVVKSVTSDMNYIGIVKNGIMSKSKVLLEQIIKEVDAKEETDKQVGIESTQALAIALSYKTEYLGSVISIEMQTLSSFDELNSNMFQCSKADDLKTYFNANVIPCLLQFSIKNDVKQKFLELCKTMRNCLRVIIYAKKTVSLPLTPYLINGGKMLFAIDEFSVSKLHFSIIAFVRFKQYFGSVLTSKYIRISAGNFIKTDSKEYMEKPLTAVNINDIATINSGLICDFEDEEQKVSKNEFKCYLKLPDNFIQKITEDIIQKFLSLSRAQYVFKVLSSVEFLQGRNRTFLPLINGGGIVLKINHINEQPCLEMTASCLDICTAFREVFLSIINHGNDLTGALISLSEYSRIENLKRIIRKGIENNDQNSVFEAYNQLQLIRTFFE